MYSSQQFASTAFAHSALVRLLSAANPEAPTRSRQDFAERLGGWLNAFDAVDLHTALASIRASAIETPLATDAGSAHALTAQCLRVKTALIASITAQGAPSANEPTDSAADQRAAFAPYRQRYAAHQREMANAIERLRDQARAALTSGAAPLRQLARLDAALAAMIGPREQRLLAAIPGLLERHFRQLRPTPPSGPDKGARPESSAPTRTPNWREAFDETFQAALLAELDVRLQPVMGLINALSNEGSTRP